MMNGVDIGAFVRALPKVDLHLHLLGSAKPLTLAELAHRHPDRGIPDDPAMLARLFEFVDFDHFIAVYTAVNRLVTSGADIVTLAYALAEDLAADNVRYAEVTVTPLSHLKAGMPGPELAEALTAGRQAAAELQVELGWVFDISGDDGVAGGRDTVAWVLRHQPAGTVALGLGGPERDVSREWFHEPFARARAAGLGSVPHAGETTGPDQVWEAVRTLSADRIGHGIGAASDPDLLTHLADEQIPLEVCPTSNVRTGAVNSLATHPLPDLLAAGVPVTVGSDDPGIFGTTLSGEYQLCHDVFRLDRAALAELARAGVRAALCSTKTRHELLAAIDAAEDAQP
jgi:aminodeoxyfutalosine deaminase